MQTETMPKEALTPEELHRQREREYNKKYYQENKERLKERAKEYWRNRYYSDPEYRAKIIEAVRKAQSKNREAYKRFKIEYGGKCTVCGNDNLKVLDPHHPDGKKERKRFILSKEFRDWVKYGIKPNVILLCANCHRELHTAEAHMEANSHTLQGQ